jgi:hypothetical protein
MEGVNIKGNHVSLEFDLAISCDYGQTDKRMDGHWPNNIKWGMLGCGIITISVGQRAKTSDVETRPWHNKCQ